MLLCLALAGISLAVLPRGVAYDPTSWLIWGREALHLRLDTLGDASAIKPLPVLVDALLAPAGSLAPVLWLLLARATAILGVLLAFRLGRRSGGVPAGLIAAIGLALSYQYISYLFMTGMSEPVAAAGALAAADQHTSKNFRSAYACVLLVCLVRVEAWPFAFAYAGWMIRRKVVSRSGPTVAAAVAATVIWFCLDWLGSGHPLRSAGAASRESMGGPLLAHFPGIATVEEIGTLALPVLVVGWVMAMGGAVPYFRRRERPAGVALVLSMAALGWVAEDVVMAQARIATGAARYLLPGLALAFVAAGITWAGVARRIREARRGRWGVAAAGLVYALILSSATPVAIQTVTDVEGGTRGAQRLASLSSELPSAVGLAGGRARVLACGPVYTAPYDVPTVSWQLRVPLDQVSIFPGPRGTVFSDLRAPAIPTRYRKSYRVVGDAGPARSRWVVLSTCRPDRSLVPAPTAAGAGLPAHLGEPEVGFEPTT